MMDRGDVVREALSVYFYTDARNTIARKEARSVCTFTFTMHPTQRTAVSVREMGFLHGIDRPTAEHVPKLHQTNAFHNHQHGRENLHAHERCGRPLHVAQCRIRR
jgi:hypothetical protein